MNHRGKIFFSAAKNIRDKKTAWSTLEVKPWANARLVLCFEQQSTELLWSKTLRQPRASRMKQTSQQHALIGKQVHSARWNAALLDASLLRATSSLSISKQHSRFLLTVELRGVRRSRLLRIDCSPADAGTKPKTCLENKIEQHRVHPADKLTGCSS